MSNTYNYQTCLEVLKIIKFRRPHSLYSTYKLSSRSTSNVLIIPAANNFAHSSSSMWNIAIKKLDMNDDFAEIKPGEFKWRLKTKLLEIQGQHSATEWVPSNFRLDAINK